MWKSQVYLSIIFLSLRKQYKNDNIWQPCLFTEKILDILNGY